MNDDKKNTQDEKGSEEIPCVQRVSAVLWPSFIAAGIANSLFFTFFEPQALLYAGGYPEISNTGVYSIGFFLFWSLTILSSAMTSYFVKPCDKVNR
jgi:hypothetical protein